MGIVAWIVFGLLAGALARAIFPGRQPGGLLMTLALGLVGAVVGGFVGSLLGVGGVEGFTIGSLLVAIGGAVLVLLVYEAIAGGAEVRR
jgi:uncharacterized membrane protein YeaQ/YmgE (transglycosylase-associated protein family)